MGSVGRLQVGMGAAGRLQASSWLLAGPSKHAGWMLGYLGIAQAMVAWLIFLQYLGVIKSQAINHHSHRACCLRQSSASLWDAWHVPALHYHPNEVKTPSPGRNNAAAEPL